MIRVGYFLGTFKDWGGASRALLNFVKLVDKKAIAPVVILTKEGSLSAELRGLGIECAIRPKHELTKNIFSSPYHVFRSTKFLRDLKLDIVHLNNGAVEWKPPIVLAAKWRNIPIIYHYHSEVKKPSPFVRYSSTIIVVSDYIKNNAETLGRPTYTVHNIVDIRRFAAGNDIRAQLSIPPECLIVSFVGQIKIIKGIRTFLRAIEKIDHPNVRFVIAGEFRETSTDFTKEMFDELVSKDERIMYLGYRSDVHDIYQTSDVIVMPSLYDEPCAMVLFEAAAANKPIVAAATGGTPEVIENNVTGILFDRDNDLELAAGINKLLTDVALRKEMGKNAYTRALKEFSERPIETRSSI